MPKANLKYVEESPIKKIDEGSKWKILIALGIVVALGGTLLYWKYKKRHPDEKKINQLKLLINKSFPIAESSLCPLTQDKTKTITDHSISMQIHYISKLNNKLRSNSSSTRNPFLPPFQKGLMIVELPPKHRLLYNKFYFFKYHLLVVTQQFEEQTLRLSLQDFKQTLLVMEAINGLFFFNSGPESGYSQKHKHMQVLPAQAFKLPIISQIMKDIKSNNLQKIPSSKSNPNPIHLFKGYEFIHGIIVAPERIQENNLQQAAIWFKQAQDILFIYLSKIINDPIMSYNVIGCNKFLLMIPRKGQKVMGEVGVNAICFMGSMLIKDIKLFDQVEHLYRPSDILREITFTTPPAKL